LSHAAALATHPGVELVGGCSPEARDREDFAAATGLAVHADFEEMLEALRPDLVSICSPTGAHPGQTRACLERGVPLVWLEKPPAQDLIQAEELEALRLGLGGRTAILVNFQRRYAEPYIRLRQAVRDETLGPCRQVELHYSRGLVPNGSHMLDLLFFVFGERPCDLLWVEQGGPENPSFALRLREGPLVLVSGCALPYHNVDFSVTCEGGRLSMLHGGQTSRVEARVEHELYPGFFRLTEVPPDLLGTGGLDFSFERALEDLLHCGKTGGTPRSSLASSLSGQRLMEAVLAEARK
jgi:predicted dehydrogenase